MTDKPKPKRFPALAELDLLTPEEVAALRKQAKENSEYFKKAFAHLRRKAAPKED